jgi:inosine-uridine nucleoside N-ribohydrolase
MNTNPIPVILDTDIGDDIDDTWALAMMLKSPELDVRLVVSETGDTRYRAGLIARLLETGGRPDIPIGIGIRQREDGAQGRQAAWLKNYELARYPGKVHADGVQAIIDTIMSSTEPVTLISIGPVPNIAAALTREPGIATKCRFVGMHGSIRRQVEGQEGAIAEYNVKTDIPACQKTFAAPWRDLTITPLDTCGLVRLEGRKYRAVCDSADPLARAVIENYRLWLDGKPDEGRSSILFDTVAVYLAFTAELLVMERMGIWVTDDGFTVRNPKAASVNVAMDWKNLPSFEDLLVERLTGR